MAFGDFGVSIIGMLGDFLLIWAILATVGIIFMFWRMPDLIYGILDQLLSERGFPRSRQAGKTGRPAEGIGGQIVGAIAERFLQPPQEGSAPRLPSAPYSPGR